MINQAHPETSLSGLFLSYTSGKENPIKKTICYQKQTIL